MPFSHHWHILLCILTWINLSLSLPQQPAAENTDLEIPKRAFKCYEEPDFEDEQPLVWDDCRSAVLQFHLQYGHAEVWHLNPSNPSPNTFRSSPFNITIGDCVLSIRAHPAFSGDPFIITAETEEKARRVSRSCVERPRSKLYFYGGDAASTERFPGQYFSQLHVEIMSLGRYERLLQRLTSAVKYDTYGSNVTVVEEV